MLTKPFRTRFDWELVQDPMTQEEARVWVAALRSGHYTQGLGRLKYFMNNTDKYCCLGVANEVLKLHQPNSNGQLWNLENGRTRPYKLPTLLQAEFTSMNDSKAMSFSYIADYIEEGFELAKGI